MRRFWTSGITMSTSNRLEKFKQDCIEVISMCENYKWSFTGFSQSDNTLTFAWDKVQNCNFSLCVSEEDYPENTLLTQVLEGEESTSLHNKPIQFILVKLRDDLVRRYKPTLDDIKKAKLDAQPVEATSLKRLVSVESTGSSVYADCMSADSDEDDDMEGYYNDYYHQYQQQEELENENSDKMNDLLTNDMEQVKLLYGERSLSYRLLGSIYEVDVELSIPLSFLNEEVAEAWKLNRKEPLIVRIHLSSLHYLDVKDPPKVEVFQPSKKDKFGVGSQLRKILEVFLSDQWKTLSNASLKTATAPKSFSVPSSLSSMTLPAESKDDKDPDPFRVEDDAIAQVVEMGFSPEVARNALIITRGNVQEALNLVLTNPESCTDFDILSQNLEKKVNKPHAPPHRQHSHPPVPCNMKKHVKRKSGYSRQKSIATSSTSPNLCMPPMEDLSLLPSSTLSGKNAKQVPGLHDGFLVQVFRYVRQRIPTLNEYCVVCDEPHVFQNGAMLKPAVCSRELCVFAFQTLGVMVDAADDIATGAEVVVLLIAMTRAACNSARKATIFDPFPTVVDPTNPQELVLSPKNKDYAKVIRIIQAFPTIQEMMRLGSTTLKKEMDVRNANAYPLLQWIIASNRSHIVKLPPDRQLSFMHTPHQFLLMSSPPAKEAKFREEKVKYGSTFAFHGSSIENWHSIIREGLIVASGTTKQMNGAAYGKGIYLSPSSSVSFGYSRMGYGYYNSKSKPAEQEQSKTRFLMSDNITCVALCEVLTSSNLKKNNDIWVCPSMDHVCTRFFFVYEDGQVGDNTINTQKDRYKQEIMRAVGYRNV
ncbi:protein mono-ADP-ribosyltransferase PARP6-like [Haliotis cracherodii]|uniref:protein mono-ADP-ribosyltransferase PARP6-like n=1 Tax=Haliotis cracherodii TaxID=6455 RepID=UPI0039EB16D3